MGQVLVRDLDDAVITKLKMRAAARGLSLEAELRDVLSRAADHPRAAVLASLAASRALTPKSRHRKLAEQLVREDRDER